MLSTIFQAFLLLQLLFHTSNASYLQVLARSEINGSCTGTDGAPGVCIPTANCTQAGGSFVSDKCPGTAEDIKCCTKTACGTGDKGNCRFTSSCSSGVTENNKCPGPDSFKCCMPAGGGGGGGGDGPTIPTTSSGCKQVAIDGAKDVVDAFPGKIKEIGCIRKCSDPSSSDHCTGMATDLMVAAAGVSCPFHVVPWKTSRAFLPERALLGVTAC